MGKKKKIKKLESDIGLLEIKVEFRDEIIDCQKAENDKYKAENAKLRKLARAYRACHDHINACRGCVELPRGCNALDMMRTLGSELGIEVE